MEIGLLMKPQTKVTEMWVHISSYRPSYETSTVSSQGKQVAEAGDILGGCNFICKSSSMKAMRKDIKSDRQSQASLFSLQDTGP